MTFSVIAKNISYAFSDGYKIFDDLSFNLERGNWISIVGSNGSGKSTLMRLILGLEDEYSGTINVKDKTAAVFQNPDDQFIGSTVEEELAFGLENEQIKSDQMKKKINSMLDLVGLNGLAGNLLNQLSGGQKQRLAIGSALITDARIIFFDEPTSMLDPKAKKDFLDFLIKIHKDNPLMTIVNITHEADEIEKSDEVCVLENGKIILRSKPKKLLSKPSYLKEHRLTVTFASKLIAELNTRLSYDKKISTKIYNDDELISCLSNLKM
ncbi:ATP-binding cassette domain-containing protein [Oenococcus alcoholitolerans]|uniref:ATP-binding cassette domain-containing protein n=1 Tax=Oenococcus alcoholitolerans TaxID=931074 RepID=UPI003F713D77